MTNSLPPRGRRRRLWGGLPQRRGQPSPRGGADFTNGLESRKQVHHGRNSLFLAPAKRRMHQPGRSVLLHRTVTATGPRLAPPAGRGARRCLLGSRNRRDESSRRQRRMRRILIAAVRHPGHRHHGHHRHHGARQHPGAERVARPPAVACPHLARVGDIVKHFSRDYSTSSSKEQLKPTWKRTS